jgi:membrane protease YdiL (CAAX protease family)
MTPERGERGAPFPTTGQAVVLTVGAALVQSFVFLLLVSSYGARVSFFGIAAIAGFGSALALAAPRLSGDPAARLGFVAAPARAWLAVPFLVSSTILVSEIDNFVLEHFPLPEEAKERPRLEGAVSLLEWGMVLCVVIPAAEELFFRGVLQPGLAQRLGPVRAIGLVAALQGLASAFRVPQLFVEVGAQGLLFGFLRHSSRSLLPCFALGALVGVVHVLGIAGLLGIPGFDDTSVPHTPAEFLLPAAVLVGIGLLLCRQAAQDAGDTDDMKPPTPPAPSI